LFFEGFDGIDARFFLFLMMMMVQVVDDVCVEEAILPMEDGDRSEFIFNLMDGRCVH